MASRKSPRCRSRSGCVILDSIGDTPLVETERMQKFLGRPGSVKVKQETLNPSRSVMDRVALKVFEEYERTHPNRKGVLLVSSGNPDFSISVGLIAAVKGNYRTLAFVSPSTPQPKIQLMKSFGVKVSISLDIKGKQNAANFYKRLPHNFCAGLPGSVNLNALVTQDILDCVGEEIAKELQVSLIGGKPPHFLVGERHGSFEIFKAIAKSLKKKLPEKASNKLRMIEVELIKTPRTKKHNANKQDDSFVDEMSGIEKIYVDEREGYAMAKKFISNEGMLCGPGGGSLLAAVIKSLKLRPFYQKTDEEDLEIWLLMSDYLRLNETSFLCDDWMISKGLFNEEDKSKVKWWDGISLSNMRIKSAPIFDSSTRSRDVLRMLVEVAKTSPTRDALGLLTDSSGAKGGLSVKGIIDKKLLSKSLADGKITQRDAIGHHVMEDHIIREFGRIQSDGTLGELEKLFETHNHVVVFKGGFKAEGSRGGGLRERPVPCGIASKLDIQEWISKTMDHHRKQSQWGVEAKTVFDR